MHSYSTHDCNYVQTLLQVSFHGTKSSFVLFEAVWLAADTDTVLFPEQYKPVLLARARYYIYQFKDNIAQSQLALDEYKKGLQAMADNLNSPQPSYMSDVRFTYLLP